MAWYLNPALTRFRNAVNAAYPNRDKTSDGTIGDEAHQAGSSDHNPDTDGSVDAWDMDVNLRTGNDAATLEHLKRVFQAHPASRYWIHNDQIARREYGWRRDSYSYAGPNRNRHTQHVHWNTRESYENSTAQWILEDDVSAEDVWNHRIVSPAMGLDLTAGDWLKRAENAARASVAVGRDVAALSAAVAAIAAKVDIDPAELEAIKASARAGAVEGAVVAADSVAAAVVARLPQTGTLTIGAVEVAVKEGVRAVLGSLDEQA